MTELAATIDAEVPGGVAVVAIDMINDLDFPAGDACAPRPRASPR
jgi:hypothetical protein